MPVKKQRNTKVARTRAAGTLTESAFWSMIRSVLRNKSRFWEPIKVCKMNARRKYTGSRKQQKWEYQCNQCKQWFPDKEINVDHIRPAGQLRDASDLPQFVETLFCEVENLQVLCASCHDLKTKQEKDETRRSRSKRIPGSKTGTR